VFTRGHLDRRQLPADGGMAEDVVRRGGFLDPVGIVGRERRHPVDRLLNPTRLVGVDGDPDVRADHLAGQSHAALVVLSVGADLQLDLPEAIGDGLLGQPYQLLVVVTEPAGGRGVCRVSVLQQVRGALGAAGLGVAQDLKGLVTGEGVLEAAEVDQVDQLLRGELGQQPPDRFSGTAPVEVPDGVDDRRSGRVDGPLLRAQPAQLAVAGQPPGEAAEIGQYLLHRQLYDQRGQVPYGGDLDVVAASHGEGESVTLVRGARTDRHIGGRVVGLGVPGVGAVELPGGREPDVEGLDRADQLTHRAKHLRLGGASAVSAPWRPPIVVCQTDVLSATADAGHGMDL
jgi:hypothetical protein